MLSDQVLELLAEEAEATTPTDLADLHSALEHCLSTFSPAHQELLLAPYGGSTAVTELAQRSGKTANALYKLLVRLRQKLFTCVNQRQQVAGA